MAIFIPQRLEVVSVNPQRNFFSPQAANMTGRIFHCCSAGYLLKNDGPGRLICLCPAVGYSVHLQAILVKQRNDAPLIGQGYWRLNIHAKRATGIKHAGERHFSLLLVRQLPSRQRNGTVTGIQNLNPFPLGRFL